MKIKNPRTDGMEMFETDLFAEQTASRAVEIDGKVKYNIIKTENWDLWEIHPTSGKLPVDLDGRFTNIKAAQEAITAYLGKK